MMLMRCWALNAAWSQWSYGIDADCDRSLISMRYQQAIDAWTSNLDSNQKGIDRVSIIHSINQAKQMIR